MVGTPGGTTDAVCTRWRRTRRFWSFLGDLDELYAVVGKHFALEWTRAGVNLQFDAINMAATMNTVLVINPFPTAIDAVDGQSTEMFPRFGLCARGILCSLRTGGAG